MNDSLAEELPLWAASARVLARLLLHEPEPDLLTELNEADWRASLEDLGVDLPAPPYDTASLDQLAADYFARWVQPTHHPPPVESLVREGRYDGEACRSLQEWARQLGSQFDAEAAGGVPMDHLGNELLLWGRLVELSKREARVENARLFAARHLFWANDYLESVAQDDPGESLQASLALAIAKFLRQLEGLLAPKA